MKSILFFLLALILGAVSWHSLFNNNDASADPPVHSASVAMNSEAPAQALPAPAKTNEQAVRSELKQGSSLVGNARLALKSLDPTLVREQREIVKDCAAVGRRQQDLMLMASGVFDNTKKPKSENEARMVIGAINRILAECQEFLRLGVVALNSLNSELEAHGQTLNSLLFSAALEDESQRRQAAAMLLTSGSPALIEVGSREFIRGVDVWTESSSEKREYELWDRAILIAGCQLGNYCGVDSIQSQRLCFHSRICNIGVGDYWTVELGPSEIVEVKRRADMLAEWLRSTEANKVAALKSYKDIARAIQK